MKQAKLQLLGQGGVRFDFGGHVVYLDPYLTNRVAEIEDAPDLDRLVAPPFAPETVIDADTVLITHVHDDHCDPATLGPLARSSADARFICPSPCRQVILDAGVAAERITITGDGSIPLADELEVRPVPAAHPEIELGPDGHPTCVGYLIDFAGRRYFHAGDTSPVPELVATATATGPVDVAILPVNERNYYRDRRGIIGNMSVREAFMLAAELGARHLVPVHWDMFAPNRVFPEEIELLHRLLDPPFELHLSVDLL